MQLVVASTLNGLNFKMMKQYVEKCKFYFNVVCMMSCMQVEGYIAIIKSCQKGIT